MQRTHSVLRPFLLAVVAVLLVASRAPVAIADGASVYGIRCAGCHGADGRAETPVARALGIRSFQGMEFSAEGVKELLRTSEDHVGIDATAIESELESLVAFLNELAAAKELAAPSDE